MAGLTPVPIDVVRMASDWAQEQHDSVREYDNVRYLDAGGLASLQELARQIYLQGWVAGRHVGIEEARAQAEAQAAAMFTGQEMAK